jgi:hypothetical protein
LKNAPRISSIRSPSPIARKKGTGVSVELTAAVTRLDALCDVLHRIVLTSEKERWPEEIRVAAIKLEKAIERLAGGLDRPQSETVARDLIEEARVNLARDFAAFGQAIADDLSRELALVK